MINEHVCSAKNTIFDLTAFKVKKKPHVISDHFVLDLTKEKIFQQKSLLTLRLMISSYDKVPVGVMI